MPESISVVYSAEDSNLIPAGITLPESLVKALEARDKAFDEYGDALVKWDDCLRTDYVQAAQDRDTANARAAIASGANPEDNPSEVQRVTTQRGKAVGIVNGLADRVRQLDREIYRAWVTSLPDVETELIESTGAAEEAYLKAERAYRAARHNLIGLVNNRAYVGLMRRSAVRARIEVPRYAVNPDRDLIQHSREWLDYIGVGDADSDVQMVTMIENGHRFRVPKARQRKVEDTDQ